MVKNVDGKDGLEHMGSSGNTSKNSKTEFTTSAEKNIKEMEKQLRVEANFDMLQRKIVIGGKMAGFFFIDGFVQEDMIEKLMQFFYSLKPENLQRST